MIKLFLIIGAPGSGKTTDANLISKKHKNMIHYSTGDMLREEVKKDSELGKKINSFIVKGNLVPLKIIIDTIIFAIHQHKDSVILIDGYPRSVEQMRALYQILKTEKDIKLSSVIEVRVTETTARNRVIGRISEANTTREDDNIAIFENRMNTYLNPLKDIQEFYQNQNILKIIDGENSIDKVVEDMNNFILKRIN